MRFMTWPAAVLLLSACGEAEPPARDGAKKEAPGKSEAQAPAPSSWPTYHGGFDLTGVADSTVPDEPVRLWRFKAGDAVETTPVSDEGRIFFTTFKGDLFAVDLAGKEVWKKKIEKDAYSSPPMVADGLLVVGTETGALHAYEAATGKEQWTYSLGEMIQGSASRVELPGGKKGVVVLSQADGAVHCIDFETGKGLWKTEPVERCDGSASTSAGNVVMGSCASALHVISVEKSRKMADIELGEDSQVAGGVALAGHLAYAGTHSGAVCAVDLKNRSILWTNKDSKRQTFTTPAVNDDTVIFGSDDRKVYGLDRETGVKRWEFKTEGSPSSPVIAGDRVVVTSRGSLYLLDLKAGGKIWSVEVSDELTSPAVVAGMIVVGAGDGTVTAFGKK